MFKKEIVFSTLLALFIFLAIGIGLAAVGATQRITTKLK